MKPRDCGALLFSSHRAYIILCVFQPARASAAPQMIAAFVFGVCASRFVFALFGAASNVRMNISHSMSLKCRNDPYLKSIAVDASDGSKDQERSET
jgi:hypothetical protein